MFSIFLTAVVITLSLIVFEKLQAVTITELTRSLSALADAYVSKYNPNSNFGSSYLCVRSWSSGPARTYIRFDLDNIPPGSKITSATLNLYMYDAPSSSRKLWCHIVTSSWTETGITWNSQPPVSPTGFSPVYTGTSNGKWLLWDVKPSVQKFVAKDASSYQANYGWQISDGDEGSSIIEEAKFESRESSSNRPYLEVKYYPPHLELNLASTTLEAGKWVKMTVYRKTEDGEVITRGALEVDLSSTSTSVNKKFSLTQGGVSITKLTIPDGSDHTDFYYYDDKVGTWSIRVLTDDYLYLVPTGSPMLPFIIVSNYGDDEKSLTVVPGLLHHFTFDTISSPKQVATPFSITITAYDTYNNVKTDYAGTNSLSDTTGTINPTITGAFTNGKWTGMVTINKIGNNVKITTSGGGKIGESNAFNVKAGPPVKLVFEPPSFTMAAGVVYSHLTISLRDANNYETTHSSALSISLLTTSSDGEFRQSGTTTKINSITIPSDSSSVKIDYYDIKGGTHTLTASATGLTSGMATVTVIPDTTPPVTTMVIGSPKYISSVATFVSSYTIFELSATDDASGVKETKYRFDAGSWNIYTSGFYISPLSEGPHTIGYYSTDRSNNNEVEKTLTIILDKNPPTISNASPTGSLIQCSNSVIFTVNIEDLTSGIKEVKLAIDGVSQGTMISGSTYSKMISLSEGSHTWSIEALDNVNNAAIQSYSFTLIIDAVPPSVSGLSAPSNPVFGESTTITCEVSDAVSGIKEVKLYYSTNGGVSWTGAAMTLQVGRYAGSIPSQMPFTNVQYYVKAVDNAGNEYQTPISTFNIGIPIWLYIVLVMILIIPIAALLFRRKPVSQQAKTHIPPPPK